MKTRVVRGISDSYVVKEAVDSVSGDKFLEVYEYVECADDEVRNGYQGDCLCDIDGSMDDTDEYILNEIDAAL